MSPSPFKLEVAGQTSRRRGQRPPWERIAPRVCERIRIDDERIQNHLKSIVRGSVEETLNALLDAEAERPVGAGRYERTEARRDTRAGSYERKLHTTAGEVKLKLPELRRRASPAAAQPWMRRSSSAAGVRRARWRRP